MPRRTYIRYKRPRSKYAIQQKAFAFESGVNTTSQVEVVPATLVEGKRKVKNITVSATVDSSSAVPIYWALVYVPEGTTPGGLNIATTAGQLTALYEPNQFVMNCGIADPSAGPIRFWSPLARNLNDGDTIVLLVRHQATAAIQIRTLIRYAITY
jgi:hypothetical protein